MGIAWKAIPPGYRGWLLGIEGFSRLGTQTWLGWASAIEESEWTDETERVLSVRINRGRDNELDQINPGRGSLVLRNDDGRFSPDNVASPLYPNVVPMRVMRVRYSYGHRSLILDGSGDYVLETQDIDLTATDFTWECWFKTEWTPTVTSWRYLKQHGNGAWYLRYEFAAGVRRLHLAYTRANASTFYILYPVTLVKGQWYHIAAVYDNDGGMELYLDGVEVGSKADFGNLYPWETLEVVGAIYTGGYSWLGSIDEVRLSNIRRYTANFIPPTKAFADDANTLYLWHLDEGGGVVANDDFTIHGIERDGSIQGNPTWGNGSQIESNVVVYDLGRFMIDRIEPHPHPDEQVCEISGYDALSWLEMHEVTHTYTDLGMGALITEALDLAEWPDDLRTLDTGQLAGITTTYTDAPILSGHILEALQSERGIIYVGVDGKVVYEDRHHRYKGAHLTPQSTINADMRDFMPSLEAMDIRNIVKVDYSGGSVERIDGDSKVWYGPRSLPINAILLGIGDATSLAEWLLSRHKDPHSKPRLLLENKDNATYTAMLTREISDRITVVEPKTGVNADFFIERVEHEISRMLHRTVWQLSPCGVNQYWLLGMTGYSELGQHTYLGF